MLQRLYNKNRIPETREAPPQSEKFFHLWQTKSLWVALKWWKGFKSERQGLSYAWLRVGSDLLGSFLIALGLAKYCLPLIVLLVISIGSSNDEAPEIGNGEI